MNALPEEVCLLIFSRLNRRDRLNARLVCKEWLRLCSDRSLTKNDLLHLDYHKISESDFYDGETKATLSMENVMLDVQDCARGRQDSYYFRTYGPGVKSMHIMFKSCCYWVFHDVFKYCTALVELKLEDGNMEECECFDYSKFDESKIEGQPAWSEEEVFSFLTQSEGSKCLNSLNIVKDRFGTFLPFLHKLVEVQGVFLNLRKLCMISCFYCYFYASGELYELMKFVVKLKSLTHLNLYYLGISNADAKSLASMPNLVSVVMEDCDIEDSDIEIVKQKAKVTIVD